MLRKHFGNKDGSVPDLKKWYDILTILRHYRLAQRGQVEQEEAFRIG